MSSEAQAERQRLEEEKARLKQEKEEKRRLAQEEKEKKRQEREKKQQEKLVGCQGMALHTAQSLNCPSLPSFALQAKEQELQRKKEVGHGLRLGWVLANNFTP